MNAGDIMTPTPLVISEDDTIRSAAIAMRDLGIGCLPVVSARDHQTLVGVITDRDIVIRCTAKYHRGSCFVREHMTKDNIQTVSPNDDVEQVLRKMKRHQLRRIIVTDKERIVLGTLSQADIILKVGPYKPVQVRNLLRLISTPARYETALLSYDSVS